MNNYMIIKINVTKRDIEDGIQNSGTKCPIYRALKRTNKKVKHVGSSLTRIGRNVYVLPEIIKQFIRNFDRNRFVKPFSGSFVIMKWKV